jgi:phosphomevalonate kinase
LNISDKNDIEIIFLIFFAVKRRAIMKRILVKENSNARKNSPRISLREGKGLVFDLNTKISSLRKLLREGNRLTTDLNKKINSSRRHLREEERSIIDIQALQKVQEQFDSLIKEMLTTKVLLAGFEIGGDDAYYEEYETETGEIE